MPTNFDRRRLLQASLGIGAMGLGGCTTADAWLRPDCPVAPRNVKLYPILAIAERIFDITVCLRPFRAGGPRLEAETIGDALVIHNYGHGGSGWSLSWGSSTQAVSLAMSNGLRTVGVVGCGALGLTSAILAQEAGAKVTIYAADLLPQTRSSRATGSWTPDSRIALTGRAAPGFGDRWEEMARISFKRYHQYLGLPGSPVEWRDRYFVPGTSNGDISPATQTPRALDFADYADRISDIVPRTYAVPSRAMPFGKAGVRVKSALQFNVTDYAHTLLADFRGAGGRIVHRHFNTPAELAELPQKTVINCSGYGARALMSDSSLVPVRGQITWLTPQPEVTYGLQYDGVTVISRRDGIVVQDVTGGDMRGYGLDDEIPDQREAETAVRKIAALYAPGADRSRNSERLG